MNLKRFYISSAAVLATVSGAHAADAIVAAEPEAVEYVRVCDAFGTGFFYIPGTENCLKIGGYARFEVGFGRHISGSSDWNAKSRGQVEFDVRSETELGALRGFIGLRGDSDNDSASDTTLHQAFLEIGGLRAGKFLSWWDDGLSGETDKLSTNANFNSVRYTFEAAGATFGIAVDELEGLSSKDNNVGIAANVGFSAGGVSAALLGAYDVDAEEGTARLIATAEAGPGTFGIAGVWASGKNAYYAESEWSVAAEYAIQATDKLKITPAAQYFWDHKLVENRDAWTSGVTLGYAITTGLSAKATVNYFKQEHGTGSTTGFIRLDRSF